jgi:phage protein D
VTTATSTYLSTPALSIAGQDDPATATNLLALTVEDSIVGMSWCEARFVNYGQRHDRPDYLYLGRDVLDFGTTLEVTLGAGDDRRAVFSGVVSALQADYPDGAPAQLLVFAEDALQNLRLTRRTRSFESASTSDIASTIARDHSLTAVVDLDAPSRTVTAQVNQSDLAFLRTLARRDDAEVWLDGTDLHVARRPDRRAGTLDLAYGGNLLAFSVRADLADQCTQVEVDGWDVSGKDAIAETADSGVLGAELASGDTSGSSALAAAFASRTERVVRATPLASDDAKALADAAYLERARRFVCGTGLTGGTAQLRVGTTVTLSGLGGLFNGDYTVTRVRHMFDLALGFRTEFDVERAGIGATS